MSRATLGWIVLGWIGFALLPWYGFDSAASPTIGAYFFAGSGLVLGLRGAWWLLPILVPLLIALRPTAGTPRDSGALWLVAAGVAGLALITLQGFTIGLNGWTSDTLRGLFGDPGPKQAGM